MDCWEHVHAKAVSDMLPRFESWEVDNELLRRYDINKKQFGVMLHAPNSDCVPMPMVPSARHAPLAAPPAKARAPQALPMMRGHEPGSSSGSSASYRMIEGRRVLSDKKIYELIRRSKEEGWLSHTDRYQQERRYRDTCIGTNIPEWLRWADGSWAPLDGADSRLRRR